MALGKKLDNCNLLSRLMDALEYKITADNRKCRGIANQFKLCKEKITLWESTQEIAFIYRLYRDKVVLRFCYPLTDKQSYGNT